MTDKVTVPILMGPVEVQSIEERIRATRVTIDSGVYELGNLLYQILKNQLTLLAEVSALKKSQS